MIRLRRAPAQTTMIEQTMQRRVQANNDLRNLCSNMVNWTRLWRQVDRTTLHYKADVFDGSNIFERVPVHRHQVGQQAGRDPAAVVDAEKVCGIDGCGAQRV